MEKTINYNLTNISYSETVTSGGYNLLQTDIVDFSRVYDANSLALGRYRISVNNLLATHGPGISKSSIYFNIGTSNTSSPIVDRRISFSVPLTETCKKWSCTTIYSPDTYYSDNDQHDYHQYLQLYAYRNQYNSSSTVDILYTEFQATVTYERYFIFID